MTPLPNICLAFRARSRPKLHPVKCPVSEQNKPIESTQLWNAASCLSASMNTYRCRPMNGHRFAPIGPWSQMKMKLEKIRQQVDRKKIGQRSKYRRGGEIRLPPSSSRVLRKSNWLCRTRSRQTVHQMLLESYRITLPLIFIECVFSATATRRRVERHPAKSSSATPTAIYSPTSGRNRPLLPVCLHADDGADIAGSRGAAQVPLR